MTARERLDQRAPDEFSGDEEFERIRRDEEPLLGVRNLRTYFDTHEGTVKAVDGVSLEIQEGEILGLVGESGSGKTVTSLSILGLINEPGYHAGGEVVFDGRDLTELPNKELRRIRGNEISMIFQEPMSSLNPVQKIGLQVGEPLRIHKQLKREASFDRAAELMDRIGIPKAEERVHDYPHEFSGGMLQRAMIAMALACEPRLLIADEPTTALDVTIQAQILGLIKELNRDLGMSMLLVTHDLGVVAETCDRVAVMYAGRIVEYGDIESIFEDPRHPYTRGLLGSVPDPETDKEMHPIPGDVLELVDPPPHCHFENRCDFAESECRRIDPRLQPVGPDQYSACIWRDPS